jgi:hypothetical protein
VASNRPLPRQALIRISTEGQQHANALNTIASAQGWGPPSLLRMASISSRRAEACALRQLRRTTAAHGVWRYFGKGRFGVTIWDLFYDVNTAQPLRYNKLRLEVTLADDRDSASARAIVETSICKVLWWGRAQAAPTSCASRSSRSSRPRS